ncbi:peptidoglycan glycosyltransferase FtsW [Arsenicicoccus dermatophilus]|uniref:peptidoglycan glycosyltransferase FtsW n=1 Tax=Arsenicicoccus dermatophilus TaxID=1076331 RepID=UPI001F4C67FF|nr:putative peptidoglycan glycosyltransferase FtsW [Arsenicicoccus dermatophilus]MCH8613237.1 putative lipid II flippase FtsW [Arsenicicoccus dermatophilus]
MTTRTGATRSGADRSGRTSQRSPESVPARLEAFLERIDTPLTTFHLLVSTTTALTIFGLVMYLSASSIRSYDYFLKQLMYAAIGAVLCVVASRIPVRAWKRLAWPGIGLAVVLQALIFVPGLGDDFQGNRNWLLIGGQRLQPSEFAKLAIVVFGAGILDRKRHKLANIWHVIIPLVPVTVLLLALQLAGQDLGTGLVLLSMVAGILFAAGVPSRLFAAAGAVGALAVLLMTLTSRNRMGRISTWLGGCTDMVDVCRQVINGQYALADGGWWGRGPGMSAEKWGWLSESRNDFIFAIIGEELGIAGTFMVLALLAVLAYACYRLVFRTQDLFVRLATAGVMTWLMVQSFINMGAVTGLLPVIGVPLPLVSGGGTAMISTLLALGMLMSFAREEPGAPEARALSRLRATTTDPRSSR